MTNNDLLALESVTRQILTLRGLSNVAAYRLHRMHAESNRLAEAVRAGFAAALEAKSKEQGKDADDALRQSLAAEIGQEPAPDINLSPLPSEGLPWPEIPVDAAGVLFRLNLVNGEPPS